MVAEIAPRLARAVHELAASSPIATEVFEALKVGAQGLINPNRVHVGETAYQGIVHARHTKFPEMVLSKDPGRFFGVSRPDHESGYAESYFRARHAHVNLGRGGVKPMETLKIQGFVPFAEHEAGGRLNIASIQNHKGDEHRIIDALRPKALARFDAEAGEQLFEGGSAPFRSGVPHGAVDTLFDHTKVRSFALNALESTSIGALNRGTKFLELDPFTAVYGSHISSDLGTRQVVGLIHSTAKPLNMDSWRLYAKLNPDQTMHM